MTQPTIAQDEESWRSRLGRQLAVLAAALSAVVFAPIAIGTTSGTARVGLLMTTAALFLGLCTLARSTVSERARSIGVVLAFLMTGTAGYATFGFMSAPGVALAVAITCAGLLLDRRATVATIVFAAVCLVVVGSLMVNNVIPEPLMSDVSPSRALPWLRSSVLTLVLLGIVGATVLLVVEILESSITETEAEGRRRREAELQVLHAQSSQLLGQLAASLAHDVNNQLTVISWWSSVLAGEPSLQERSRAGEAITQSIEEANGLTRRLLMLGRRDTPIAVPVQLAEFLKELRPILHGLVPSDVDLAVSADDDVWARVDPSQLRQVLLNLVMNARDAMPGGGKLSIEAHKENAPLSDAADSPDQRNWLVLSVEDSGVGMDAETIRRAIEPFFTTKSVDEGTGLGLTTVVVFAEEANGRVHLESELGCGTRVELWLPARDPAPSEPVPNPQPNPRLDGAHILIVDDTPEVLDVARAAFVRAGATVTVAVDGDDALRVLRRAARFDALCTDAVMPGAPVSEVIDAFRDLNPDAVTLLCSGYVGEELIQRGIDTGRYRLLAKPYQPQRLIEEIAALLAARTPAEVSDTG